MVSDAEGEASDSPAAIEALVSEVMRLRNAIVGHRLAKQARYDTPDVILWSHVEEE